MRFGAFLLLYIHLCFHYPTLPILLNVYVMYAYVVLVKGVSLWVF